MYIVYFQLVTIDVTLPHVMSLVIIVIKTIIRLFFPDWPEVIHLLDSGWILVPGDEKKKDEVEETKEPEEKKEPASGVKRAADGVLFPTWGGFINAIFPKSQTVKRFSQSWITHKL